MDIINVLASHGVDAGSLTRMCSLTTMSYFVEAGALCVGVCVCLCVCACVRAYRCMCVKET